jgi:hypothetical protein
LAPDVQQVWGAEQHLWVGVAALGTSFDFDAALATIGRRTWPARSWKQQRVERLNAGVVGVKALAVRAMAGDIIRRQAGL